MHWSVCLPFICCFLASRLTKASAQCTDTHRFCEFWSTIGECEKNPEWMVDNCQKSCKTCKKETSTATDESNGRPRAPPVRVGVNNPAKCEQLRNSGPKDLHGMLTEEGLIIAREDTTNHNGVTLAQARGSNSQIGCAPAQGSFIDCRRNACYNLLYRTMDGTCNSLSNPLFGAAFVALKRLRPPEYDDGVNAVIASIRGGRPSAREASRFLLSSSQVVSNNALNALVMQFGQFLSHDLAKTTMLSNDQCRNCNEPPTSNCMAIKVNPLDPSSTTFGCQGSPAGPQCCVRTARSTKVCGTGDSSARQQYNENTAFIDASMVYGSSVEDSFRFRNGNTGFLRATFFNNRPFMPFESSSPNVNFQAGDDRANLFLGLGAFHTVFLREHNRLVGELQRLNPQWDGDRLFQEARKIVGAELQVIVYKAFLPHLLGSGFDQHIGRYVGYDPNVDPSISNVFTTGAFRFGHGMVNEFYPRLDVNGNSIGPGGLRFLDGIFQSSRLLNEGGVDPILRGLMGTPAKRPHRITTSMTERLFGNVDLASVNIERARDHGLPSYNTWREFCGFRKARTFEDLSNEVKDQQVRRNLEQGYGNPDGIDLYVGQLLEDPVPRGMVGPTLACLIGDQFKRLRDGDRFYFENPGVFTDAQRRELDKVLLSRILCDNGDFLQKAPTDAFAFSEVPKFTPCEQITSMSLRPWQE